MILREPVSEMHLIIAKLTVECIFLFCFRKKELKSNGFLQLQGLQCYCSVTLQGNVNVGKGSFERIQSD